jgi:hypothetical protein
LHEQKGRPLRQSNADFCGHIQVLNFAGKLAFVLCDFKVDDQVAADHNQFLKLGVKEAAILR